MNEYEYEEMIEDIVVAISRAENEDGIDFYELCKTLRTIHECYLDVAPLKDEEEDLEREVYI